MDTHENPSIVVADESALYLHLHSDGALHHGAVPTRDDPLLESAVYPPVSSTFNPHNPLYGGTPVSLLVGGEDARRRTKLIFCRSLSENVPPGSFLELRDKLYVISPELVYARMGNRKSEFQLAEIGMNLCGRYYLTCGANEIEDRSSFLTTPENLRSYLCEVPAIRGTQKALSALRWVVPNSGSPEETKMKLQYCTPLWAGGFGLPFTHMNFDVKAGRLASLMSQSKYCVDLANPLIKAGMEYDGEDSHEDASKDKRRINELKVLGWNLFPIDKSILYNPDATYQSGFQLRKFFQMRGKLPKDWERRYVLLRDALNLPI